MARLRETAMTGNSRKVMSKAGERVMQTLAADGELPLTELTRLAGVSASPVKTLAERGLVEILEREVRRDGLRYYGAPETKNGAAFADGAPIPEAKLSPSTKPSNRRWMRLSPVLMPAPVPGAAARSSSGASLTRRQDRGLSPCHRSGRGPRPPGHRPGSGDITDQSGGQTLPPPVWRPGRCPAQRTERRGEV